MGAIVLLAAASQQSAQPPIFNRAGVVLV